MRTLSASEAISPAIDRTKAVLFQPFLKGRSWKLAATAYLALVGSVFIPTPLAFFGVPRPPGTGASFTLLTWLIGGLMTVVMFAFFYVGARLQFVLFDIVLRKETMVAPLWRRYASQTWRWVGLKLALSIAFVLVTGFPLVSSFRYFTAHVAIVPGQPLSPEFIHSLLFLYGIMMVTFGALTLCSSLLNDFILPPLALENVTLGNAASRLLELIKREPAQLVSYIFFKILLTVAGVVAMEIGIIVAELILLIPLGLIAGAGWWFLRSVGPAGQLLLAVGGFILALILIACLFYLTIGIMGCCITFFQAYALFFLGGRYPLLGDILEPPAPDLRLPSATTVVILSGAKNPRICLCFCCCLFFHTTRQIVISTEGGAPAAAAENRG